MAPINPITGPIINNPVQQDYFEIFRERIAEILLIELQQQSTLTGNQDFNFTKIWRERTTTFNLAEVKAINLSVGSIDYDAKYRGDRQNEVVYNIDVYISKIYEGSESADQLSMEAAWHVARTIEFILDHPEYAALKAAPHVKHTEVRRIVAGEAETDGAGKLSILRIEFAVNTFSSQDVIETLQSTGSDTTVKLGESDFGFFYQINN